MRLTDPLQNVTRYAGHVIARRKVQKLGNGSGLFLSKAMLDALGVRAGDMLVVRVVGDNLIVRRDSAAELTPEALRIALDAEPITAPPPAGLRAKDAHLVAIVHDYGPLRTVDVARKASWTREWTSTTLHRLAKAGWVVKTIAGWELGPAGRGWVAEVETEP